MRATRKTGFDSAPSSIMASLYDQLEALVLAAGVPRPVWDEFTQALKMSGGPITCWLGATTPGEMTLRAWQSETRVDPQTAGELAEALVALLRDEGARCIEDGIGRLLCCRGSESSWRAPLASRAGSVPVATATSVTNLCRHYFDLDVSGGLFTRARYDSVAALAKAPHVDDRRKFMALFQRPLGKRSGPPGDCGAANPPHPERFDMLWVVRERDVQRDADEVRDSLGLIHFRRGGDLVIFVYNLPDTVRLRTPTAVEALGGWAYWAAEPGKQQRTMNYRDGTPGPREFVHSAEVDAATMEPRWVGNLARNWDDAP